MAPMTAASQAQTDLAIVADRQHGWLLGAGPGPITLAIRKSIAR